MEKSTTFLARLNLNIGYRPDAPVETDHLSRIQLRLDAIATNSNSKTLILHASIEFSDLSEEPIDWTQKEREIGHLRFDPTEYSCLVVRFGAIGRTTVLIVENEKIGMIDRLLDASKSGDVDAIEITSKTVLIDNNGARTAFSHNSQTIWPVGMVDFFWTDIAPKPEEKPKTV